MGSGKGQSEFRYDKGSGHLPMFGAGSVYVIAIGVVTALAILLDRIGAIPSVRPEWGRLLFLTAGIVCVLSWPVLWGCALFRAKLDDGIMNNRLVTSGAYACVRNPIYTAFALLFCGALLMNGNALTFCLPPLYWWFMTALLRRTEERWLAERYGAAYVAYCSRVNRCIPGIPNPDIMYETAISDALWIAFDLPGNAGWMLYFAGLILSFARRPAFMSSATLMQIMVVALVPALLMLIGIAELISERV